MLLGKNLDEKLAIIIATWFYTGLIPYPRRKSMAGTWGSLFAIPFCIAALYLCIEPTLSNGSPDYYGIIIKYGGILVYIYFLGHSTIRLAEKVLGPREDYKKRIKSHDQNQIVIDEIWGMFITYYPIFFGLIKSGEIISWSTAFWLALGFGYFRMFDIIKIWPVKFFDRIEEPFGVMMDDGVAGLQAGTLLYITSLIGLI